MAKSYQQKCPIACALDVVGERWTLLIVRELLKGARRFSELQRALTGMAPNLLSSRLRVLSEHGIAQRDVADDHPPRVTYSLTEAGRALWLPLRALGIWGTEHLQRDYQRIHATCGEPVVPRLVCEGCDEILIEDNTSMRRRPVD